MNFGFFEIRWLGSKMGRLDAELSALLNSKLKVTAIKRYRDEIEGASLKEAVEYVNALQSKLK